MTVTLVVHTDSHDEGLAYRTTDYYHVTEWAYGERNLSLNQRFADGTRARTLIPVGEIYRLQILYPAPTPEAASE